MKSRVNPLRSLALVLLGTWLIGCATPSVSPETSSETSAAAIAQREAKLLAFDRFRVSGGLGILTDTENLTARLDWNQVGTDLSIGLQAPLGLGTARLERDADGVRLLRGKRVWRQGRSADRLLQDALGLTVEVPVDQISAWIRGLPGSAEDYRRDDQGRLASLNWRDESGVRWRARVLAYTDVLGLDLPSLVTARGGDYHLRLVLKGWQDDPTIAGREGKSVDEQTLPTDPPASPPRIRIPGRV